jgi:hypothetical protein
MKKKIMDIFQTIPTVLQVRSNISQYQPTQSNIMFKQIQQCWTDMLYWFERPFKFHPNKIPKILAFSLLRS